MSSIQQYQSMKILLYTVYTDILYSTKNMLVPHTTTQRLKSGAMQ